MNLDELIKAAVNPTPVIIAEINRRAWEAQGNKQGQTCKREGSGRHTFDDEPICECGYVMYHGYYDRPTPEHEEIIPDYAKPENFWPLVEQSELTIKKFQNDDKWDVGVIVGLERGWEWNPLVASINPGIAVCLAYLTMMEAERETH